MDTGDGKARSVNEDDLLLFIETLFKHVDPGGWVNIRAFRDDGVEQGFEPHAWRQIQYRGGGDWGLVFEAARALAVRCAQAEERAVFCPPVATFKTRGNARDDNVANGPVLLVECDQDPRGALKKLEDIIGPATLVNASGGQWTAPNGTVHDKLHLYWRLTSPARTEDEQADLRELRKAAVKHVGSDPTSVPLSHPIRWPGSWHRKGEPRQARIVTVNPDAEITLTDALTKLREVVGEEERAGRGEGLLEAPLEDVRSALIAIPNEDDGVAVPWDEWRKMGMRVWRATGGSDDGLAAWEAWSAKSPRHHQKERCGTAWGKWRAGGSRPERTGAGKLFAMARDAKPEWRRPSEEAPPYSDEALALELAEERCKGLRYTDLWRRWNVWNGNYWAEDETLETFDMARALCRRKSRGANKGAKSVASAKTVNAVLNLTKSDRRIAAMPTLWNSDPWLLGTPRGTVDLRQGILLSNGVDNYITNHTRVAPGGACPGWLDALTAICDNDQEMVVYLQRLCGYILTGSVKEEKLFFLHGDGGTGKGTFSETFAYVMGTYATAVAMTTLLATRHPEHPTELAKLAGKRFGLASETPDGGRFNVPQVKKLTGGDVITARFMHGDFFDYWPTIKMVLSSNSYIGLGRVDNAIVRRMELIPFTRVFRQPDLDLKDKLKTEAGGILQWAIDGCLAWQKYGLRAPAKVRNATQTYLRSQDDIQMFVEERCVEDPNATTSSALLYSEWGRWCDRNGAWSGSKKDFTQRMGARYAVVQQRNLAHFKGLRLEDGLGNFEEPCPF